MLAILQGPTLTSEQLLALNDLSLLSCHAPGNEQRARVTCISKSNPTSVVGSDPRITVRSDTNVAPVTTCGPRKNLHIANSRARTR